MRVLNCVKEVVGPLLGARGCLLGYLSRELLSIDHELLFQGRDHFDRSRSEIENPVTFLVFINHLLIGQGLCSAARRRKEMRKLETLFMLSAVLLPAILMVPALAGLDRFEVVDGLVVVRHPQKAIVGRNFNLGIYVADSLVSASGSGGDYDLAVLYISVSGPIGSTCVMWNDWFEAQSLTIGPVDDLIVTPYGPIAYLPGPDGILGTPDDIPVYAYSMEYDEAVSKLGDVVGWTGNVVCKADMAGEYTFTLTGPSGFLGSFTVTL